MARAARRIGSGVSPKRTLRNSPHQDHLLCCRLREIVSAQAALFCGATVEVVRKLKQLAGVIKIKAAGGIRDLETALAMIQAGADRVGTSASVRIVRQLRGDLPRANALH